MKLGVTQSPKTCIANSMYYWAESLKIIDSFPSSRLTIIFRQQLLWTEKLYSYYDLWLL